MGPSSSWPPPAPLTGPAGTGLTRGVTSSSDHGRLRVHRRRLRRLPAGHPGPVSTSPTSRVASTGARSTCSRARTTPPACRPTCQEVQQLVNQNNVFAVFSLTQDDPARLDRLPEQQPGAVLRLGLPPRVLRLPVGLRLERLPGRQRLPESHAHAAIAGNLADAIIKASGLRRSKVRFAVQAENSQPARSATRSTTTLFKARGAQVVYMPGPTSRPRLRRRRHALRPGHHGRPIPNIVFISTPFADVGPLRRGLRAAGYKGIIYGLHQLHPGPAAVLAASWPRRCRASTSTPRWCPQEENTALDPAGATPT